jgi:hypothetical protein
MINMELIVMDDRTIKVPPMANRIRAIAGLLDQIYICPNGRPVWESDYDSSYPARKANLGDVDDLVLDGSVIFEEIENTVFVEFC